MGDLCNGGKLVVRLPLDHWARIDRRILDDCRLSIDARGVLAWAGSRPEGHVLWITNLMKRCAIGKDKWQRIRLELQEFGYLTSEKVRNLDGRFGWIFEINLCFEDTMADLTIAGKTVDGKHGYIKRQESIETGSRDNKPSHHPPAACAAGFKAKPSAKTSETSIKTSCLTQETSFLTQETTPDHAGSYFSPKNDSARGVL